MTIKEWLDPKVLVAVYAAILSTINILITIFSKRRNLKVKIFVERKYRMPVQTYLSPTVNEPILHIEIINKSKTKIYVKKVVLNYFGIEYEFTDDSKNICFPNELGYGEVIDCTFNLFVLEKKGIIKKGKVRANAIDTLDKFYKSNSLKNEDVEREILLAHEESKKIAEKFNKIKF